MGIPIVKFLENDNLTEINALNPIKFGEIIAGTANAEPVKASQFPIFIWNDKGGAGGSSTMRSIELTWKRGKASNEYVGYSLGTASQAFYLDNVPVIAGSQTVKVGGVVWVEVDNITIAGVGQYYQFTDSNGKILFGDGTNGSIPAYGAEIRADYTPDTVKYGKEWEDNKWSKTKSIGVMPADGLLLVEDEDMVRSSAPNTQDPVVNIPLNSIIQITQDFPTSGESIGMGDGVEDIFYVSGTPVLLDTQIIYNSGVTCLEVEVSPSGQFQYLFDDPTGKIDFGEPPASGNPIVGDYTWRETYVQDTDYAISGNYVDWSLAGAEPSGSSVYQTDYKFVAIADDSEGTFTSIGGATVHSIGDIHGDTGRKIYIRADLPAIAQTGNGEISSLFRVAYQYI